ncbi:MAG: hypothetical protein M3378_02340 [Actinomycetota bacterium]|nr:hypothetical protein [Actinomycetota bacterium]MDQ3679382.1 hypothetical protein [Actinomycetota bacterium]
MTVKANHGPDGPTRDPGDGPGPAGAVVELHPPPLMAAAEDAALDEDLSEAELRDVVERSWARLSLLVDRMIGSGRLFDREVLIDLARFLENAMPAVRAYERLVGHARDAAIETSGGEG